MNPKESHSQAVPIGMVSRKSSGLAGKLQRPHRSLQAQQRLCRASIPKCWKTLKLRSLLSSSDDGSSNSLGCLSLTASFKLHFHPGQRCSPSHQGQEGALRQALSAQRAWSSLISSYTGTFSCLKWNKKRLWCHLWVFQELLCR